LWARNQSGIFHIACNARNIICLAKTHWYFRPACWERERNGSLRLMTGVSCHKTKTWIESNVKITCCAIVPLQESGIRTYTAGRKVNGVTETVHMGESNWTNLQTIPTILFFLTSLWIWEVLVLRTDNWRGRPRSITTPSGREVYYVHHVWPGVP
jgi:hypothetical protein